MASNSFTKVLHDLGHMLQISPTKPSCPPPSDPSQRQLRWGCDQGPSNRVVCRNAQSGLLGRLEPFGSQRKLPDLEREIENAHKLHMGMTFYDSKDGLPVFSVTDCDKFWTASRNNGCLTFCPSTVVAEHVHILPDNKIISVTGTHLGEVKKGKDGQDLYVVNAVAVAGYPRHCRRNATVYAPSVNAGVV